MLPSLSVIVPVFRAADCLPACVDSVLAQTFQDFECLLIDDASPDASPALCDAYTAKDARIRVIHQANAGVSAARNTGLDAARGEYIAFVDADDELAPEALATLAGCVRATGADMAACGFVWIGDVGGKRALPPEERQSDGFYTGLEALAAYHNKGFLSTAWGKLSRASLFDGLRFPVGKRYEDEFILHRLLFRCKKITSSSAPLYRYRIHAGSFMQARPSLKRLDSCEALYDRCLFYKDNGLNELYPLGAMAFLRQALKMLPTLGAAGLFEPEEGRLREEEVLEWCRELLFATHGGDLTSKEQILLGILLSQRRKWLYRLEQLRTFWGKQA